MKISNPKKTEKSSQNSAFLRQANQKTGAQELRRQLFHLFLSILLIILFYLDILKFIHFLILFVLSLAGSVIQKKHKLSFITWFIKTFDRPARMPAEGVFFLFAGFAITTLLFSKNIAISALLVLAIGDSLSPLIGLNFGRLKNPINNSRYVEGFLIGWMFSFIACLFFLSFLESLIGTFFGMLVESLELKKGVYFADDNILVPLATGAMIILIRAFLI